MNRSKAPYTLLFMLVLSAFFGVALATINHVTRDTLLENERFFKNRVLSRAFMLKVDGDGPGAYEAAVKQNLKRKNLTLGGRTFEVFITGAPLEKQVGFLFSGSGVWGPISGVVVLSGDLNTILNIQFLDHQETPGLGARIEEPWFTRQFQNLPIPWDAPVQSRIVLEGTAPDAKNRIDTITGASQTPLALIASLNRELESFRQVYLKKAEIEDGR